MAAQTMSRSEGHDGRTLPNEFPTALAMFRASAAAAPDAPLVRYFDTTLTFAEVDGMSDALAVALSEHGLARGDRVAVVLQNIPQYFPVVLAAWKIGAVPVPINPMYKRRELHVILADSGAVAAVCLESVAEELVAAAADTDVRAIFTTSELDLQTRDDPRIFAASERRRGTGTADLLETIERYRGRRPEPVDLGPDDLAYLPYTSGTTGPPKGSMSTHANVVFTAQVYRDSVGMAAGGGMFAVAPLFHITGLIGHIAAPMLTRCPAVLTCRFHPVAAADAIREHGATRIIGAITVFIAWTDAAEVAREHLASLQSVFSGGAPVPEGALAAFRDKFGHYIHNGYGLTETNSPAITVPFGAAAPVDPESGAVSIGTPVADTVAEVVGDDDAVLPVGEVGEIVIAGPQVCAGYWNKPDETSRAMPGGRFHTGDVGLMDADGWFYIVDRKKDQINASGFKVWPREVEDVLYAHPAVREAAVVGAVDRYRGETVKAVVSLKSGAEADEDGLIAFCRERMAAYKVPRTVEIRDELPKTVTGKILRRALRGG
ncbi:AMP-binding protein [Tomitella cavernea]|uniref:Long-chain acyl-CoA synthetase n=1 Tax=Tomitella cavernea TaxID=1387982 RepID=A0ABP9D6T6_9ACTN|nr:AMP-binding protein [Tomitella cavernea]